MPVMEFFNVPRRRALRSPAIHASRTSMRCIRIGKGARGFQLMDLGDFYRDVILITTRARPSAG
jgi:hypothetical protein